MKPFKLIVISIILLMVVGCSTRVLDFTVISSKNVKLDLADGAKGERVKGEDMVYFLISIPLGTPNLKEAVDRAIESAGPDYDALIDGVIYSKFWWILITGQMGYVVEGTPIKTSMLIAQYEAEGKDANKELANALYHSKMERDNTKAIENIGITEIHEGEKPDIKKN
ncbi:MAG: hypothetical protein ABIJ45_11295 [Candidatus Zixiibacteriota bacterium]